MSRCIYCMEIIENKLLPCPHCGNKEADYHADSVFLQPGVVLQGKYEIGVVLGAGGFGITYVGWDMTLQRKVAIKEYYPRQYCVRDDNGCTVTASTMNATEKFESGLERFLQEAKSLRELHGVEGVVSVDNFFRENGTGYIIMEYLEGRDLKTVLRESSERVDYEWCRRVILTILDTLSKIHEKGILHRDIAPDNVLITKEGIIKLIDFGAARHEEGIEVENTESLVKSGYSPIEQYTNVVPQGPYTDLYATAALMYFMLTGKKPPSAIDRRDGTKLDAPSDMGIVIPEKAQMGMMMCLNVMPEHRLESAKDFMETLEGADFTPDYEPAWNLIPEKKKGLKSTRVKVELFVALFLLLVLGGVGVSYMLSDNGIFSPGGVGSIMRIPSGIVNEKPEDAIKRIRDEGIKNRIKIVYEYDPTKKDETVMTIFPDEGEKTNENDDVTLTVGSSRIVRLDFDNGKDRNALIGDYEYSKVQRLLKKSGIDSSTDSVLNKDSLKYGQVDSIEGINLNPDSPVSGDNVEIVDSDQLVELISADGILIKYSIGTVDDYEIKNKEINDSNIGVLKSDSKKKIVEKISEIILNVLSKREHMRRSDSFKSDKEKLRAEIISRLIVKSNSVYSDRVSEGRVIKIESGTLDMNPSKEKKNNITVVFSKGKKPENTNKENKRKNENHSRSNDDEIEDVEDGPSEL